jgi:hypothetical protein
MGKPVDDLSGDPPLSGCTAQPPGVEDRARELVARARLAQEELEPGPRLRLDVRERFQTEQLLQLVPLVDEARLAARKSARPSSPRQRSPSAKPVSKSSVTISASISSALA